MGITYPAETMSKGRGIINPDSSGGGGGITDAIIDEASNYTIDENGTVIIDET
tara:strand:+ start:1966 stop:2124 length:159 start_codon:yes stop_codon:yes gene_type:complete